MLFTNHVRRIRAGMSRWISSSKQLVTGIRRLTKIATSTVLLLAIASGSFTSIPILRPTSTTSVSTASDLGPAGTAHMDIGSSGAYQTAVPIEVPLYHGLEPALGFVYNSNGGNSWLGVGWDLSGLSTIRRTSPGKGAPNYDNNDVFYLDGMELILCTAAMQSPSCKYPASPSYIAYTTKIESFQRVAFNPAWTGSGGWHVWTKTGTKMTYEARVSDPAIGVFAWNLASVEDTLGNKVAYSYWHDGTAPNWGEEYIYAIIYNGTFIKFYYESRPIADVLTYAIGGDFVTTRFRLKAIDVQTGSSRTRAYALKYSVSSSTSRSLLEGIQQFGKDATIDEDATLCAAVASGCQFGAVTGGTTLPEISLVAPSMTDPGGPWNPTTTPISSVPAAAIPKLTRTYNSFLYSLNTTWDYDPIYGDPDGTENPWLQADLNADGREDFLGLFPYKAADGLEYLEFRTAISNRDGTRSLKSQRTTWRFETPAADRLYRFLTGDVNGDEKGDLIYIVNSGPSSNVTIKTFFSKGDGTFDLTVPSVYSSFPGWSVWPLKEPLEEKEYRNRWMIGDANSDGKSDIMVVRCCNNATFGVGLSEGDGTFTIIFQHTNWSFELQDDPGWYVGDANGDGKSDFMRILDRDPDADVQYPHAAFQVALSKGNGTFDLMPLQDTNKFFFQPTCCSPDNWFTIGDDVTQIGDFNGDGKSDIAFFGVYTNDAGDDRLSIRVAFSNADGTFYITRYKSNLTSWRQNHNIPPAFDNDLTHPNKWRTGDINGDGATDLLVMSPNDFRADFVGSGTHVDLIRLISDKKGQFSVQGGTSTNTNWVHRCYSARSHMSNVECEGQTMFDIFLGDVNGDHRADVTYIGNSWTPTCSCNDYTNFRADLSVNTSEDMFNWKPADVNGDGRQDLVYIYYLNQGYIVYTLLRDANGNYTRYEDTISPPTDIPVATMPLDNPNTAAWMPMDVGGGLNGAPDGKDDLVYVDHDPHDANGNNSLLVYTLISKGDGKWTKKHWGESAVGWFPVPDHIALRWMAMDVNGDGRQDLVHIYHKNGSDAYVHTLLSMGDGLWDWIPSISLFSGSLTYADEANWRPADINGDGKMDLVLVNVEAGQTKVRSLLSATTEDGGPFGDPTVTWTPITDVPAPPLGSSLNFVTTRNWMPMLVNGDGMTDLVYVEYQNPGVTLHMLLSKGNGKWQSDHTATMYALWPVNYADTQNFRPMDVNRDGKTDLVHVSTYLDGSGFLETAVFLISNNYPSWSSNTQKEIPFQFADVRSWRGMDSDGDGRLELVYVYPEIYSLHWPTPLDRITQVSNGQGGVTRVNYSPSSSFRTNDPSQGCHLPIGAILQVVSAVTVEDGRHTVTGAETYSYACARWSYKIRGFLTWQTVTSDQASTSNRPSFVRSTKYQAHDEGIVQPIVMELKETNPKGIFRDYDLPYQYSFFIYPPAGNDPPYESLLAGQIDYQCNQTTSVCHENKADFTRDEFGNIQQILEYGSGQPAEQRTLRRGFNPATGPYIVGLPSYETIFQGLGATGKIARSTMFIYDANAFNSSPPTKGLLTAVDLFDDQLLYSHRTNYAYDAHGNLEKETDPNLHETTITYDNIYHIFPQTLCNALKQCSTVEWDYAMGQPEKLTDVNHQSTQFEYDALGRLRLTTLPNGGKLHRDYLDIGDPARQRIRDSVADGSHGGLWAETFLDGLGRIYRVFNEGDTAGVKFAQDTIYADDSSQVLKQSHWYRFGLETPVYESFVYDGASRLLTQTHPDNSFQQWRYTNDSSKSWVTYKDEENEEKVNYYDALGRTIQVRETNAGKYSFTSYTYNVVGNLLTITDNNGNSTDLTWDSLGRQLTSKDPDRGLQIYEYDDVGNLRFQTDARGFKIEFTYDALNRLKTKVYPDGRKVEWNYDEGSHGESIGLLTSVTDTAEAKCPGNQSEYLTYDGMGQVTLQKQCIEGRTYAMGFDYDQLGRQKSLTYPDHEIVTYHYDSAGRLHDMSGYVNSMSYDAAGNLMEVKYSNQTKTTYIHDPKRQWLKDITVLGPNGGTASNGSKTLYQAGYEYFANGLIQSTNSSTNKMNLIFSYDDVNRLTGVSGDLSQTFQYDAIGNMTDNSEVGTYTYVSTTAGNMCGAVAATASPCPHAVKSTVSPQNSQQFKYDANGNMIFAKRKVSNVSKQRSIKWNADNQPFMIQGYDGIWTRIHYDAGGQRVYQERKGKVTQYYGDYMDLSYSTSGGIPKTTQYYYAGNMLVARKDSTGKYWYHQDMLGSTRLLTNQNGQVVQRYDYTPFGETSSTSTNFSNNIQYAGHRSDDANDLIYMNARYYDPQLARFISADSIIADAGNPQALNRYSYVYNNPILYTDPTGHQGECNDECTMVPYTIEIYPPSDASEWASWPEALSAPPLVEADTPQYELENASENLNTAVAWLATNYPPLFPSSEAVRITEGDPGEENQGHTDQFSGNITIIPGLSVQEAVNTVAHELMHSRLTLLGRLMQNARFSFLLRVIGLRDPDEHVFIHAIGDAVGQHYLHSQEQPGYDPQGLRQTVWGQPVVEGTYAGLIFEGLAAQTRYNPNPDLPTDRFKENFLWNAVR